MKDIKPKGVKQLRNEYCVHCGRKMRQIYQQCGYHIKTGKPAYEILWRCPKKRWYNWHSQWRSNEEGDTYAYQS